ncbi:hypothetical protein GR160_07905 [Flavobacterium sp. Sd200]|uniref:hypothetical protein n=1 Tax=Flavobacterium sp. Sd200 TaxID=2692211 RepID=UPI0013689E93|nr:hypothetical protein [Flavobacterium sp. Sd200]MXN91153.1 hypothetical protein [Flavobacterium sp. Sd200]
MKQLLLFFSLILFISCGRNDLSHEEAARLLKSKTGFPRNIDYEIYRGEPRYARRLIQAGLEREGFVKIQKDYEKNNDSRPIIHFTDKAKPYLLFVAPDNLEYFTFDIQKVKLAEEQFQKVNKVTVFADVATVEYTTIYKNLTPFAILIGLKENKKITNKAIFMLTGDGWVLQEK